MGTGPRAAEAAFDELKVYKRPLSNGEVYDEYRRFMPVDLLVDRTVIDAGKAIVGGLGIVMLAIVLDRITQGLGRSGREKGHRNWWRTGPIGLVVQLIDRKS